MNQTKTNNSKTVMEGRNEKISFYSGEINTTRKLLSLKLLRVGIIVLILFMISSQTTHSQFFLGGDFNIYSSGGKYDNGTTTSDQTSAFGFRIMPEVGIFLSEKFAVGTYLTFDIDKTTNPNTDPEEVETSTTFGLTPFARYYAVQFNRVQIYGQGNLGFSINNEKTKAGPDETEGPSTTRVYFSVFPGVAYELNEHIELRTSINLINLSYNYEATKMETGGVETKDTDTYFNFGAGIDNLFTIGNITVGAIYKF